MPWHFSLYANYKYGYTPRSPAYTDLKMRLLGHKKSLEFSGQLKSEILSSYRITATGTRGARLHMKASLLGATSGKVLDVASIERMLLGLRRDRFVNPTKFAASKSGQFNEGRLIRLLQRLKKTGGQLTRGQEQAIARNAELTAIAKDELNHLARIEEQTFHAEINRKLAMRMI